MSKTIRTKSIVITALFAAVVFLGIQSFRIPMPAAVGTPFLHFGHIFVMLAIVCLGPKRSAIAGTLGLVIFDILNGYIHAIPNVLVSTIIKCLLVGVLFEALKKKTDSSLKAQYKYAILCAGIYGVTNILLDFLWNTVELVILGNSLEAALLTELASIPATILNAGFTVIGIALLFIPVKSAYKRVIQ